MSATHSYGPALERGLRRAWGSLPAQLRHAAFPPLKRAYGAVRSCAIALESRNQLWQLSYRGILNHARTTPITARLIGTEIEIENLQRRLFAKILNSDEKIPLAGFRAQRLAARTPHPEDLLVAILPTLLGRGLAGSHLLLPASVEVVADAQALAHGYARGTGPLGKYQRRVEGLGLTRRVSQDSARIADFYEQLYRPTMRRRFGAAADLRSPSAYQRYQSAELLELLQDGQVVAACVCLAHDERYRFLDVGYAHDDARATGLGHALYDFAVRRVLERGLPQLDFGPERPFLDDPILHYKQQWCARLEHNTWAGKLMALSFNRPGDALHDYFVAAPWVLQSEGRFFAFTSPRCDPSQLRRRHGSLGLAGIAVFDQAPTELALREFTQGTR